MSAKPPGEQYPGIWNELPGRVGLATAQRFLGHVAMRPGQPPQVGTSSVMTASMDSSSNPAAAWARISR